MQHFLIVINDEVDGSAGFFFTFSIKSNDLLSTISQNFYQQAVFALVLKL